MNKIIKKIVREFSNMPEVEAILLGGSRSTPYAQANSDWDLYIYTRKPLPIEKRWNTAHKFSYQYEINNQFWETGDEWILAENKECIDIMYRSLDWIKEQLHSVVDLREARIGYTTSFWFNLVYSQILFDRSGKLSRLQKKYQHPYPEELKKNIILKNHPILRTNISSYYNQIKKAYKRNDHVSINHRVAALLASYFDILFAINEMLHPGEKKLVSILKSEAHFLPRNFSKDISCLLCNTGNSKKFLPALDSLLNELDELLIQMGYPNT